MIDHASTWFVGNVRAVSPRPKVPLTAVEYPAHKLRRDRNRAAGRCINETLDGRHGLATHGCRCKRCYEQHKKSR